MRLNGFLLSLALGGALVACTGKDDSSADDTNADADTDTDTDSDADTDADTDTDADADAFRPQAGAWTIEVGAVTDNSCTFTGEARTIAAQVTVSDATHFMITEDKVEHYCKLAEKSFACDPANTDKQEIGADATQITSLTLSGAFTSPAESTGSAVTDFVCDGDGCAAVEAKAGLPCQMTMPWTGTAD